MDKAAELRKLQAEIKTYQKDKDELEKKINDLQKIQESLAELAIPNIGMLDTRKIKNGELLLTNSSVSIHREIIYGKVPTRNRAILEIVTQHGEVESTIYLEKEDAEKAIRLLQNVFNLTPKHETGAKSY